MTEPNWQNRIQRREGMIVSLSLLVLLFDQGVELVINGETGQEFEELGLRHRATVIPAGIEARFLA